jgi:hypothetical protein
LFRPFPANIIADAFYLLCGESVFCFVDIFYNDFGKPTDLFRRPVRIFHFKDPFRLWLTYGLSQLIALSFEL